MHYKIACTGSSGSGKTTLVKFIANSLHLRFISGSAGDIKTEGDKQELLRDFGFKTHMGHTEVIRYSAINKDFGYRNQCLNQMRRQELIEQNDNFITDRSPVDNLTYFISQIGFHAGITDEITEMFAKKCLKAWRQLTHVIYIKAVQPNNVEDNGSRVPNKWYQKSSDAQFEYWLLHYFIKESNGVGPYVKIIDYWDWARRKEDVMKFLHRDTKA